MRDGQRREKEEKRPEKHRTAVSAEKTPPFSAVVIVTAGLNKGRVALFKTGKVLLLPEGKPAEDDRQPVPALFRDFDVQGIPFPGKLRGRFKPEKRLFDSAAVPVRPLLKIKSAPASGLLFAEFGG